jgi:hypothetical protein
MLKSKTKKIQRVKISSLMLCIDFHFQVFADTSVRDNDVDVSVSTSPSLRLAPEERLFGISCVGYFLFQYFNESLCIFHSL